MTIIDDAQRLRAEGQWPKAVKTLRKHLKQRPGDAAALELLAQTLFDDGDEIESLKTLDAGRAKLPPRLIWHASLTLGLLHERCELEGPFVVRRQGQVYAGPHDPGYDEAAYRRGHRVAAIQAYDDAWQRAPERLEALLLLVRALIRESAWGEALPRLEHLLAADPADVEARFLKALCLVERKSAGPAREILHKLAEERPTDDAVLQLYNRALELTGESDESGRITKRRDALGVFPAYVVPPDEDGAVKLVRDALAGAGLGARALAARASLLYSDATKLAVITAILHHGLVGDDKLEDKLATELAAARAHDHLWGLARESKTASVRKHALWALARARAEGIFSTLVRSLPFDVGPDFLDVAGALAEAGDARAVPALKDAAERSEDLPARRRAALALGSLITPDSVDALEALINDVLVGPWAAAARFRQSKADRYLNLARVAAAEDEGLKTYLDAALEESRTQAR